jgi:hypothetical protein
VGVFCSPCSDEFPAPSRSLAPLTHARLARARRLQQSIELQAFLLSARGACAHMEEQRPLLCGDEWPDSLDRAEVRVCVCVSVCLWLCFLTYCLHKRAFVCGLLGAIALSSSPLIGRT